MTEHYKGQRIEELLNRIAQLEQILHENSLKETMAEDVGLAVADGFATLAIAKAKLTSLKGD